MKTLLKRFFVGVLIICTTCNFSLYAADLEAKVKEKPKSAAKEKINKPQQEKKAAKQSVGFQPKHELLPFKKILNLKSFLNKTHPAISRKLEHAILFLKTQEFAKCEKIFNALLALNVDQNLRKAILQNMAYIYCVIEDRTKEAFLYEKYVENFKHDGDYAPIMFRIGNIYKERKMYDLCIPYYYSVMNHSLSISISKMKEHKRLVLKAQLAIANAHFENGEFKDSYDAFVKIKQEDLPSNELQHYLFRKGFAAYQIAYFGNAVKIFEEYCKSYLDSVNAPEAYFYIVQCYKKLSDQEKTVASLRALLKEGKLRKEHEAPHWENWSRWQQSAAKDIAQEYFDKRYYLSAIKVYQEMVNLREDPDWQWPILYSLGTCYEKVHLTLSAKASYKLIIESHKGLVEKKANITSLLNSFFQNASWRLKQLEEIERSERAIQQILMPAQRPSA